MIVGLIMIPAGEGVDDEEEEDDEDRVVSVRRSNAGAVAVVKRPVPSMGDLR